MLDGFRRGKQRNDISVDLRRHLAAKNRKRDVLLIRHACRTAHTIKCYCFLLFMFRPGWQILHAYKSFKSAKSESERAPYQNQGPKNLSHCVLCGLPNGTFVHSLQNIAFRSYQRAERDNARHTLTRNIFTIYSRAELGDNACMVLRGD